MRLEFFDVDDEIKYKVLIDVTKIAAVTDAPDGKAFIYEASADGPYLVAEKPFDVIEKIDLPFIKVNSADVGDFYFRKEYFLSATETEDKESLVYLAGTNDGDPFFVFNNLEDLKKLLEEKS